MVVLLVNIIVSVVISNDIPTHNATQEFGVNTKQHNRERTELTVNLIYNNNDDDKEFVF